jgi:MFS family permease
MKKTRFAEISFFYGWIIVGLGILSTAFWMGIVTSFSVFFTALIDEFHWSRGGTAGVQSMALLTYTILAPFVGSLIDRFGPKKIILPGIILLSTGVALCSQIHSLLSFYIFYGIVVAAGFTCINILAYSAILSHWFERRRGIASGITVSGMGLGTFLLVPMCQYLINLWGWRLSYLCLGALVFCVLFPLCLLFLRNRPEELGLQPDGPIEPGVRRNRRVQVIDQAWANTNWTVSKAMTTARFWALLSLFFLSMTGLYVLLVHEVRFLVDRGFGRMTAAYILSLIGAISIFSRIFWGWLSDRIGREKTVTAGNAFVAGAAIFLLLLNHPHSSRIYAYLFAVTFGIGWGVTAPMLMAMTADLFQGRRFGSIYGVVEAVVGAGSAVGAWLAGFIFDKTGSYDAAFFYTVIVSLVSCVFVWIAAPGKVRRIRVISAEEMTGGTSS